MQAAKLEEEDVLEDKGIMPARADTYQGCNANHGAHHWQNHMATTTTHA